MTSSALILTIVLSTQTPQQVQSNSELQALEARLAGFKSKLPKLNPKNIHLAIKESPLLSGEHVFILDCGKITEHAPGTQHWSLSCTLPAQYAQHLNLADLDPAEATRNLERSAYISKLGEEIKQLENLRKEAPKYPPGLSEQGKKDFRIELHAQLQQRINEKKNVIKAQQALIDDSVRSFKRLLAGTLHEVQIPIKELASSKITPYTRVEASLAIEKLAWNPHTPLPEIRIHAEVVNQRLIQVLEKPGRVFDAAASRKDTWCLEFSLTHSELLLRNCDTVTLDMVSVGINDAYERTLGPPDDKLDPDSVLRIALDTIPAFPVEHWKSGKLEIVTVEVQTFNGRKILEVNQRVPASSSPGDTHE